MSLEEAVRQMTKEAFFAMRAQSAGHDQNDVVQKMRELTPELLDAYINTDYVINLSGKEIILKVHEIIPDSLMKFLETKSVTSWAMITAYNPYSKELTENENKIRQQRLIDMLQMHDFELLPAIGRSEDGKWEEPSVFILGISYDLAKSFGFCFQQNAVLFGDSESAADLIFC